MDWLIVLLIVAIAGAAIGLVCLFLRWVRPADDNVILDRGPWFLAPLLLLALALCFPEGRGVAGEIWQHIRPAVVVLGLAALVYAAIGIVGLCWEERDRRFAARLRNQWEEEEKAKPEG